VNDPVEQPQVTKKMDKKDYIAGPNKFVNESEGEDLNGYIEKPDLSLAEKLLMH
jgi:hypothetical protein